MIEGIKSPSQSYYAFLLLFLFFPCNIGNNKAKFKVPRSKALGPILLFPLTRDVCVVAYR